MWKRITSAVNKYLAPTSKYGWVSLRDILWRDSLKTSALVYPFIGGYIVAIDSLFFTSVRWEMYLAYTGALLFFLSFYIFSVVCPFYIIRYSDLQTFISEYSESDDNELALTSVSGVGRPKDQAWDKFLGTVWEANNGRKTYVVVSIKVIITIAGIMVAISGIASIVRVYATIW